MSLPQLAEVLGTEIKNFPSLENTQMDISINTDTRTLKAKETFWALRGENFDGHTFVNQAVSLGCHGAVVENGWLKDNANMHGVFIPVEDCYQSLLDLGSYYSRMFGIPKFAITGSNGKTTTKDMLSQILASKFKVLNTKGNLNNHIGVPMTLFNLNSHNECAVIEMGSNHPGEISALSRVVGPSAAIITNIGYSHVEFLKNLEGVFKEKSSIADGLKKEGLLIVNGDDPYLNTLKSNENYSVLKVGIESGEIRGSEVELDFEGRAKFTVENVPFQLSVPGIHNVYNALLAIAAAKEMGVSLLECSHVLENFQPSNHRMQILKFGSLTIMDDCYNANPNSTLAAIKALAETKSKGRKVALLGDMAELGEMGPEHHARVGETLAGLNVSLLIAVGSLSKNTTRAALAKGFPESRIYHFETPEKLLSEFGSLIQPEDSLLIKGSRFLKLERAIDVLKKKFSAK